MTTKVADFEKIVSEHKNLNALIHEHKSSPFMFVKERKEMTPEFIDWISPKYFEAFQVINERRKGDNTGAINTVLRESYLANVDTKVMMAEILMPEIESSIKSLGIFLEQITESKYKSIEYLTELANGLYNVTINALRYLETETLVDKKKVYSNLLLAIADRFKNVSKMRDEINFNLYVKVNEALKNLKLEGEMVENRVEMHQKKLGRKGIWYIVWAIIIGGLLLIRLLGKMS